MILLPVCAALLTMLGSPATDVTPPRPAADTLEPVPAERPTWSLRLTQRHEWSRGTVQDRQLTRIGLTRAIGRGALIGELLRLDEPKGTSLGAGAELYAPLWHRAEGHALVAASPGAVSLPDRQVRAELVQHVGSGWHASVAAEHRRYDHLEVQLYLAGAGWSSDAWYVRSRAGVIDTGERMATGHIFARRIFPDGRSHVEAAASAGGDVLDVLEAPDHPTVLTATSRSFALQGQVAVSPNVVLIGGLHHAVFRGFGRRTHGELGISLSR